MFYGFNSSEAESGAEEKEQEEVVTSTVRPEEIPPIPENRFLMRRSPQAVQKAKEEAEKDKRHKEERPRERLVCSKSIHYEVHPLCYAAYNHHRPLIAVTTFPLPALAQHIILSHHIIEDWW